MELLVLANSRKLNGRCVAGIDIESGRWIRPVGSGEHGAVTLRERRVAGRDPGLLDVIQIELGRAVPLPYQRENFKITPEPWSFVRRASVGDLRLLDDLYECGPELFGNFGDRLPEIQFSAHQPARSLTLVKPQQLRFAIATFDGRRRNRIRFALQGTPYDLAVTDPQVERILRGLEIGSYAAGDLGLSPNASLTVSVGEPFHGDCYKLVAAVLPL